MPFQAFGSGDCAMGIFRSRSELKLAVDKWVDEPTEAEQEHGHISGWDVSRVDNSLSYSHTSRPSTTTSAGGTRAPSHLDGTFWHAESFDRYIGGGTRAR